MLSGLLAFQQHAPASDRSAHDQAPLGGCPRCPRHETGPSTTFNPGPSTIPRISQNPQGVYLRFCFRRDAHGREMLPKRSRWAGFVAGGQRWCPKRRRVGARRPRDQPGGPKRGGRRRCRPPRGAPRGPRGPFRALRARLGPRAPPPESFSKIVLASPSEFPYSTSSHGGVAQLGERLTGSQEVRGSIPLVSTRALNEAPTQVGAFFHIGTQGQRRHHDPSGRQDRKKLRRARPL